MFKMTDALDEIISMSNDNDIKSKVIERSSKKNKDKDSKDGKSKGKYGKGSKYDDDDSDEDDIDDDDDEDDYDEFFKKQKSGAIDIVGSAKKKRKKVNKKQLGKDLQNNKIRQIKVSMPYSVNADNSTRVIDYNNSRHAGVDGSVGGLHSSGIGGMGGMGVSGTGGVIVPFYKQSWFKTLCTILITIACSLIMCVVVMQAYKHVVYRIRTNPLADDKKKEEDKMSLTEVLNSQKETEEDSEEEFDKLAESEDEKSERKEKDGKDKNKVKGGMIGGSKRNNIKGGSKSLPQRDSRGRFMKRS